MIRKIGCWIIIKSERTFSKCSFLAYLTQRGVGIGGDETKRVCRRIKVDRSKFSQVEIIIFSF